MSGLLFPYWTRWLWLGLPLLAAGCATLPESPGLPPGAIAVVSLGTAPQVDFNVFARGKAAAAGDLGAKGAASGAAAGAIAPLQMGPIGIAAYPLIAPFTVLAGVVLGGTVGATYGAMHGLSPEQVEQVNALAERVVAQLGANNEIAKRLAVKASGRRHAFELYPQNGPVTKTKPPDYSGLRSRFGAVVEVAVEKIGMAARKGEPARIALEMPLRVGWVPLAGGGASGEKHFQWAGKPRTLNEWQAGGAAMLAREFEMAYESLSDYAAEYLVPMDDLPDEH